MALLFALSGLSLAHRGPHRVMFPPHVFSYIRRSHLPLTCLLPITLIILRTSQSPLYARMCPRYMSGHLPCGSTTSRFRFSPAIGFCGTNWRYPARIGHQYLASFGTFFLKVCALIMLLRPAVFRAHRVYCSIASARFACFLLSFLVMASCLGVSSDMRESFSSAPSTELVQDMESSRNVLRQACSQTTPEQQHRYSFSSSRFVRQQERTLSQVYTVLLVLIKRAVPAIHHGSAYQ